MYDKQFREEIDADRAAHGKKPHRDRDDDDDFAAGEIKELSVSTTDPESGLFHKGEHKVEYTAHVACDENNVVLSCEVTPGNVRDSTGFDRVYDAAVNTFAKANTLAADAGYKIPWICKRCRETREIFPPHTSAPGAG